MTSIIPKDSIGIVKPELIHFDEALTLRSGKVIESYDLMVECYGELNQDKSNAILICHALSGDHHAAGFHGVESSKVESTKNEKPGWWDTCIGPGKPIDSDNFFIVSLNNLGGCAGSTGPTTINPVNGKPYGPDFPIITVRDWVNSQARLADRLGINQWAAVIGGSLGGMQALRWAISYPERLRHAIAFNEVARQSITTDPNFHQGHYYEHDTYPQKGLTLARMIGHITYLSDSSMRDKFGKDSLTGGNFGRDLSTGKLNFGFDVDFQVESYLQYKGESFSSNFDANSYLLITKTLDYFDPAVDYEGDLSKAFLQGNCKFLVVSFSSDWRFPPERSHELVNTLLIAKRQVSYLEIDSDGGHDAFLLPVPRYLEGLSSYLSVVANELPATEKSSHAS